MLSKLDKLKQACTDLGALSCPVCHSPLEIRDNTLVCASRHSYNLNRKGCVSFLSKPSPSCYDSDLFAARSRVFASGAYDGVADAIASMLPSGQLRLLDAGCGDGWYLDRLLTLRPDCSGAGIDISRDAILAAAAHESPAVWCVGDLRKMPFADGAFDAVLDILTPADYSSFQRVLKANGMLIKVFPGDQYLQEIRRARALPNYAAGTVEAYLRDRCEIVDQKRVTHVQPVDTALWHDFVYMTPLNQDLSNEEKDALPPQETVTVDLQVASVRLKSN